LQPVHDDGTIELRLVALVVPERNRPAGAAVEAFERLDEMAEERVAPHLAIGDDVEAGILLQGDRFVDGPILDALEFRGGQATCFEGRARVLQILRPEQAADDIALECVQAIQNTSRGAARLQAAAPLLRQE